MKIPDPFLTLAGSIDAELASNFFKDGKVWMTDFIQDME